MGGRVSRREACILIWTDLSRKRAQDATNAIDWRCQSIGEPADKRSGQREDYRLIQDHHSPKNIYQTASVNRQKRRSQGQSSAARSCRRKDLERNKGGSLNQLSAAWADKGNISKKSVGTNPAINPERQAVSSIGKNRGSRSSATIWEIKLDENRQLSCLRDFWLKRK